MFWLSFIIPSQVYLYNYIFTYISSYNLKNVIFSLKPYQTQCCATQFPCITTALSGGGLAPPLDKPGYTGIHEFTVINGYYIKTTNL